MSYLNRTGLPRLHYIVDDFTDPWKNAPYLVLQHGMAKSSQFWYPWIPYLSRDFKIIRPDLRGFGLSATDFDLDSGFSVQSLLGDLVDLFDHLGVERVHYCGESLGGIIGMVFAAEHPERLRSLSLISAPVKLSDSIKDAFSLGYASWQEALRHVGSKVWAERTNVERFAADTDPGLLSWYAEEMGKSDIESMIAISKFASRTDVTPYLSRISAPILGIYPKGSLISGDAAAVLKRETRNASIVEVQLRHHAILNAAPAECAGHVLSFATTIDGSTPQRR